MKENGFTLKKSRSSQEANYLSETITNADCVDDLLLTNALTAIAWSR